MTAEKKTTASRQDEAFRGCEDFVAFGKDNVEAVIQSCVVLTKGAQQFNKAWLGFAQTSAQDSVTATRAILGCKTVQEVADVQIDLARAGYAKLMTENQEFAEMTAKLTGDAVEPIAERVTATVERFSRPLTA